MKTSRTAALAAASALALSLSACGGNDQDAASTASGAGTAAATTAAAGGTASATSSDTSGTSAAKESLPIDHPKNLDEKSQGLVANPKGPEANTLGVYVDPQCPICAQAEKETDAPVGKAVTAGTVRVVVHPMTFLDGSLKNDSSSTMANALVCASDAEGKLLPYMKAMFALQPAKEGDGYAADAPGKAADTAGIKGEERTTFDACVKSKKYAGWVAQAQAQYAKDGVQGTPTYSHNGKIVKLQEITLVDFQNLLAGKK